MRLGNDLADFRILLLVATRSTFLVLKVSAFEVPFGLHFGPF